MKSRVRLSRLLPAIQVPISAVLSIWASRVDWMMVDLSNRVPGRFWRVDLAVIRLNEVWHGLNAPAFPGAMAGLNLSGQSVYLIGVALMWWTVGRAIDRRRGLLPSVSRKREITAALATLAWGLLLLLVGSVEAYPFVAAYPVGRLSLAMTYQLSRLVAIVLHFAWGIALVALAGSKFSGSSAADAAPHPDYL